MRRESILLYEIQQTFSQPTVVIYNANIVKLHIKKLMTGFMNPISMAT